MMEVDARPTVRAVLRGAAEASFWRSSGGCSGGTRPTTRSRRRFCARCAPTRRWSTAATCARGRSRSHETSRSTLSGASACTSAEVPDLESVDEPLPYEELKQLTAELPQKERAAVFLRYGYDLSYDDIGAALGSSTRGGAAGRRRPASAGYEERSSSDRFIRARSPLPRRRGRRGPARRRLRPGRHAGRPAARGRHRSRPLRDLLRRRTRSARRSSSPGRSARASCARRSRRTRPGASSTSTSPASGRSSTSAIDLRPAREFGRAVLDAARPRPVRRADDLRHARRAGRPPPRRPRGRDGDEPQPGADRASVPPRGRLDGLAGRLRRRPRPQAHTARAGRRPPPRLTPEQAGAMTGAHPSEEADNEEARTRGAPGPRPRGRRAGYGGRADAPFPAGADHVAEEAGQEAAEAGQGQPDARGRRVGRTARARLL